MDVFIAVVVILVACAMYIDHLNEIRPGKFSLLTKAQTVSGLLMSPGYPEGWDQTTVVVPGIVQEYEIDETRIFELYSLGHSKLVALFQVENNVQIYLVQDNAVISISGMEWAGRPPGANARDIAHVERVVLYQKRPAVLHVVTWI